MQKLRYEDSTVQYSYGIHGDVLVRHCRSFMKQI
jgi:hypothetical protein